MTVRPACESQGIEISAQFRRRPGQSRSTNTGEGGRACLGNMRAASASCGRQEELSQCDVSLSFVVACEHPGFAQGLATAQLFTTGGYPFKFFTRPAADGSLRMQSMQMVIISSKHISLHFQEAMVFSKSSIGAEGKLEVGHMLKAKPELPELADEGRQA